MLARARLLSLAALLLAFALAQIELAPIATAQDEAKFPFEMIAEGVNVVSTARSEEKVRAFYGESLGLEELDPYDIPDTGKMIRFLGGVSELKFIIIDKPLPSTPGGIGNAAGIRMLSIFVNDPEGVVERLKKNGFDTTRFFDKDGKIQRNGYTRDPEDNEIAVVFLPDGVDQKSYRRMRINLTIRDDAKSRKFYGQILGLTPLAPASGGGDDMKLAYQAGPTTIRFLHADPTIPKPEAPVWVTDAFGMHYIQFIVQDVDATFAKLVEKGAPVAREPFDLGTLARIAMVWDPDGTVVELAGPLPSTSD